MYIPLCYLAYQIPKWGIGVHIPKNSFKIMLLTSPVQVIFFKDITPFTNIFEGIH